jgi:hypothetical protein
MTDFIIFIDKFVIKTILTFTTSLVVIYFIIFIDTFVVKTI